MITDQFAIFFDSDALAASGTGQVISAPPYSGRNNPINVTVTVNGAEKGDFEFALEQSDGSGFAEVVKYSVYKREGENMITGFAIPQSTKEQYLRLLYAFSGDPTGMTIFAGVTRDHMAPYSEGQYITNGKVIA